jgi:hypothetical protein
MQPFQHPTGKIIKNLPNELLVYHIRGFSG